MKIKCNSDNFFKIYNDMQGVSNRFYKIKKGKKVRVHNYTYYAKIMAILVIFIFLFPLIFRVYNFFIKILITKVSPFIITFLILYLLLFHIGYYYAKKRLGGEVHLSLKGIKDVDKTNLSVYVPWDLVDYVYVGEYGIYFFVKRHIIIFLDIKYQEQVINYLKKEKINILIYRKED